MIYPKYILGLLAVLVCSACTTPAPTYRNPKPAADDAQLIFESDFELHTHFSANVEKDENSCGQFRPVGYLLKKDSVFIYDKPNLEIKIKVPTNKVIGIAGYHAFDNSVYKVNCYPGSQFFIPKPNETYVVKMNRVNHEARQKGNITGVCYLSIESVNAEGNRTVVETVPAPLCAK